LLNKFFVRGFGHRRLLFHSSVSFNQGVGGTVMT
jgi:hypothetical protein